MYYHLHRSACVRACMHACRQTHRTYVRAAFLAPSATGFMGRREGGSRASPFTRGRDGLAGLGKGTSPSHQPGLLLPTFSDILPPAPTVLRCGFSAGNVAGWRAGIMSPGLFLVLLVLMLVLVPLSKWPCRQCYVPVPHVCTYPSVWIEMSPGRYA
jgi:hypothetical protein